MLIENEAAVPPQHHSDETIFLRKISTISIPNKFFQAFIYNSSKKKSLALQKKKHDIWTPTNNEMQN